MHWFVSMHDAVDGNLPLVHQQSKREKKGRLEELCKLRDNLLPAEVLVYQAEVVIRLSPKMGDGWVVPGRQKEGVTPGKTIWIEGESKNSVLFMQLL